MFWNKLVSALFYERNDIFFSLSFVHYFQKYAEAAHFFDSGFFFYRISKDFRYVDHAVRKHLADFFALFTVGIHEHLAYSGILNL
ncbi:hypothetical protein SDC9_134761 [bioreactor metagenome]|uniref:Uncharacterized protein n=1 Tax=bioreactor metagenome TaxID=1076179 RepID=A0A645DEH8_9ZZZZ